MNGSSILSLLAYAFVLVALWFGYAAFSMDTSVVIDGNPIANLELMHYQSQNLAICIGAVVVAAVMMVGSEIVSAIKSAGFQSE